MDKKTIFSMAAAATLCAVAALSFSCVDNDYRFGEDDIDLGVEIAPGGLDVPIAVIEEYRLGELLEDVDNVVVGPDGFYAVRAADGVSFEVPGAAIIAANVPAGDFFVEQELPSIDLTDITAGIEDLGAVPDLVAPRIVLSVENPAGVAISGEIVLTPRGPEGEAYAPVVVEGINVEPASTRWFFIAEEGVAAPDDRDYTVLNPADMADILKEIPHSMDAEFAATLRGAGGVENIDPGTMYTFETTYDVLFPLAFGPGMNIPLDVSEDGLNETFHDLSDYGVKASQVGISVELESSFPFRVSDITTEFRDEAGNLIPGLNLVFDGIIEGPGSSQQSSTSRLTARLEVPGDGDFAVMSRIDRLEMHLRLSSTAGEGQISGFSPDDYIRGRVWASVPAGVTVDLDKLNGDDGDEGGNGEY